VPDGSQAALQRMLRTEGTIVRIRWAAVAFGLLQVFTYYLPHPPAALPAALACVALLAAGNVAVSGAVLRVATPRAARRLGLAALGLDIAVIMGLVFVYTFDPDTAMFALVYVLPLEGAVRFRLRGALVTMAVAAGLYSLRELFGALVYGNDLLLASISFRMGIGFIIAAVAGAMAGALVSEREDAERASADVRRQAALLAAANDQLTAAGRVKDDFLAMANHELRTPLTTILGYTGTLQQRWDAIPDAERLQFLRRIDDQGQRLLALVESLLTIASSRGEGLEDELEPVDVRAAVLASIQECGLDEGDVAVDCDPGVCVWSDAGRLRQILTNYLSNAVKYGAPPLAVAARRLPPWLEITVSDQGPGVPDTFVPHLFQRFSQASRGDSRTAQGTGLGLAIVAQLTEAQGGRAWHEPNTPAGARFVIRLLDATPPQPGAQAPAPVSVEARH
jgi:signal transduction histidine kinase